ncbi:MAG: caspase family protein [Deltaproteobacteria bacterium]
MRHEIFSRTFYRLSGLLIISIYAASLVLLFGEAIASSPQSLDSGGDEYLIVDCLLPGAVRKLGRQITYLTPRRPLRTSERDCEIRGGEYVSYDRSDYKTSLRVWLEDAKKGDAAAQTYVGEIYEKGLGTAPDFALAAEWYKKAADQGYSRARINLGHLYEKGLGTAQDLSKALALYGEASDFDAPVVVAALPAESVAPAPPPAASSAEEDRLREEVSLLRQQLEQTRRELEQSQKQLEARKSEAESSRRELERTLEELEKQKDKARTSRNEDEVRRLEQKLGETGAQLAKRDEEIKALAAETEKYRVRLAGMDSDKKLLQATVPPGPKIEMIDPPMPLTRGIAPIVKTKPGVERVIVGKITAPAGLHTFMFNNREEKIDQNGMFRLTASIERARVPVKLVAIDKTGSRAALEFWLMPEVENGVADSDSVVKPSPALDFGDYYALIIGNTEYIYWPGLETPKNDAVKVAAILRDKYGFKTQALLNATRRDILQALNEHRKKLTERDNLLIYFAGHGYLDEKIGRGYWIPVDGERDSPVQWISTSIIADFLGSMSAKHVLVVADSCYSGALTRSSIAQIEPGLSEEAKRDILLRISKTRSRTVLSSGDLRPVLDGGGGEHSIFAKAFLEVLRGNGSVLEGQRLHASVSTRVARAADALSVDQEPQYAPIKYAGHESGDFLFVPKR